MRLWSFPPSAAFVPVPRIATAYPDLCADACSELRECGMADCPTYQRHVYDAGLKHRCDQGGFGRWACG